MGIQNINEAPLKKKSRVLPIYSVTPFTMLDFPDRIACIIWFSGCNMRCPYCHNPQIVKGKGKGSVEEVLAFLEKRKGLLDGVVLSGGEASYYPGLPDFIRRVKDMGYAIKLDTNGLRPEIIETFLAQNILDYVALDYKAPPEKFKAVTGVNKFELFHQTLDLLSSQNRIPFEIRTTVHTDLLDENDIELILKDLENVGYTGKYFVQNFCNDNDRPTLGFLKEQKRTLNIESIPKNNLFTIEYRNF